MVPRRPRLIGEVLGAGVLGLVPVLLWRLIGLAETSSSVPPLISQALSIVALVAGPGVFVGSALAMLVHGFHTTDVHSMDRVGLGVGVAVNVIAFAALWFMLRTGSKESLRWKVAVALLVVWVVVSVPFGVFASLWRTS